MYPEFSVPRQDVIKVKTVRTRCGFFLLFIVNPTLSVFVYFANLNIAVILLIVFGFLS